MPKQAIDDLAVKTFSSGDSGDEREKETDHEERHSYYKELRQKEMAGQKLEPHETDWMQRARESQPKSQQTPMKQRETTIDNLAVKEFSKPGVVSIGSKPETQDYDPLTPQGSTLRAAGAMMTSQDPRIRAFGHGYYQRTNTGTPQLLPNASQAIGEPVAVDEMNRPVYSDKSVKVIPKDAYRTADRRPSDVSIDDKDKFGSDTFEKNYAKHLQAVDDNDGKYPAGYFKGMSPEKKDDIKKGVMELIRRRRGTRI